MNHADDAVTQSAKSDLVTAYDEAAGRLAGMTFPPIYNLGDLTLSPGVYADSSSFGITGILTLDAGGDPSAVWVFQAGSTLTTAPGSKVLLTGGAQPGNVFWQVGSSATLGTGSLFAGTILALDDITLTTGAVVDGRVLARNGAEWRGYFGLQYDHDTGACQYAAVRCRGIDSVCRQAALAGPGISADTNSRGTALSRQGSGSSSLP